MADVDDGALIPHDDENTLDKASPEPTIQIPHCPPCTSIQHRPVIPPLDTTQQGLFISLNSPESNDHGTKIPLVIYNLLCSRKRLHDVMAEFTMKMSQASDTLIQHIQESSVTEADHKRMKMETKIAARELKAHESRDEHEHLLCTALATQIHELAMADQRTKQLELEVKLEQIKLDCLALEKEKEKEKGESSC
ncbi:uncharacterized protein EDB93DRAFT_1247696 [Suillus bovinus]|uniref:uncharacterized protein n=1 Tax=Suillus bovinus TaxID=48563 RepID=UPI001B8657A0|nr:uncharacterized protein EDB93DRAFT_1247696 [Suillus bovinus]KAG2155202.1 hypothetical protein EDB93DRAFT_1247696 [Suillus bovinus]